MCAELRPIIRSLNDNVDELNNFAKELVNKNNKESRLLLNSPVVYIHNWKKSDMYHVYVGETSNIVQRTKEHYDAGQKSGTWQNEMASSDGNMLVIAHDHFNKSLTLDIENKLIAYMLACPDHVENHNGRGNPQDCYYTDNEFDDIFQKIWLGLGKKNSDLFIKESEIKKSAIYKASPLHKLYPEQRRAKEKILQVVEAALDRNEQQLVFVEGEAGTGKTVVMSSTFYELYVNSLEYSKNLKCCLVVNHNEQLTVYEQITKRLGFDSSNIVFKPASFINKINASNPVDVVFVDEAHLLLTQGNQGYSGKNQLEDIMKRAKITVVMYDEWQNLSTEQYWDFDQIDKIRNQAAVNNNYVQLKTQLRIAASSDILNWIDSITKDRIIKVIPKDDLGYDIMVFDTPEALERAIKEKASNSKTGLSRLVATYDWEYNGIQTPKSKYKNDEREYWEVNINGWRRPWNYELANTLSNQEKKKNKTLAWAEQAHTINEIGSTYTIQGFDLNYVGVILGPSVKYRDGKIMFDPSASKNKRATQKRTLLDGSKQSFGEMFLQHEFKVLMTRGVNGLYIYACDDELREALMKAQHPNANIKYECLEVHEETTLYAADEVEKYGK